VIKRSGQGAGRRPTAVLVVADLSEVARLAGDGKLLTHRVSFAG
jgi:hypothetical protein